MKSQHLRSPLLAASTLAVLGILAVPSIAQTTTLISSSINNGSFETPITSNFVYAPTGTPWTFTPQSANGGSGIAAAIVNAGFNLVGSPADGNQYAFLQVSGSPTATASISQTFNLTSLSNLSVSFALTGRSSPNGEGGVTKFSAAIDGNIFFADATRAAEPFNPFSAQILNVGSGTHTLTFTASQKDPNIGDNTALLDNVTVTATAVGPEPGSLALYIVGAFAACWAVRKRTSR